MATKIARLKSLSIVSLFIGVVYASAPSAQELTVVELFTSQGCYSCPAADKLISELSEKDQSILNLEFHVDYWNQLRHRDQGNWEDPFSSPEYTQRQRTYSSRKLAGENGVYTPQAVINGVYGAVGSNRRKLTEGLGLNAGERVVVNITEKADATLSVQVDSGADLDAEVYLVNYLKRTETSISSGENHDKLMVNHNVVVSFEQIASLAEARVNAIGVAYQKGENLGCAILVQSADQGPILGAARCPE